MITEADLDAMFAALADPTRRSILAKLARGEASVMELAEPFDMSQPAITKHLNVLERAGLITRRRDGQRRPCKLEPKRLEQLARWLGTFQEFWEDSFSRMDDYLKELQREEKADARTDRSHRKPR
jgi:DNA-binding transcriptional ArsR family regulator